MKKLLFALSLCAFAFCAAAHQGYAKTLPKGEKVVDIKVTDSWQTGQTVYVLTRPMEKDEPAECYKLYTVESRFHTVEKICERKE